MKTLDLSPAELHVLLEANYSFEVRYKNLFYSIGHYSAVDIDSVTFRSSPWVVWATMPDLEFRGAKLIGFNSSHAILAWLIIHKHKILYVSGSDTIINLRYGKNRKERV